MQAEQSQPITLGQLTDLLASMKRPDDPVMFDFGDIAPAGLASYRGYYDHLALSYSEEVRPTVESLLVELREADGKVYEGYKGGDFRMSRDTPLWVANYGRSGGTCVTGAFALSWGRVIITTGYCDDWEGGMQRARDVLFRGLGWGNAHA